jgi:N-acetylmuramoyl-L-alanine amidase
LPYTQTKLINSKVFHRMKKRPYILFIIFHFFLTTSFRPLPRPAASTNKNSLRPFPLSGIKTVVIDAGHGGKDPGCLGITTSLEKHIALAIALKVGKYIQEKTPDVKVIYTRNTDVFIDLDERAAIANKNKADLFICIHCNTACSINKKTKKKSCNEEIFGTETYVMGLHKTNANLNVAKRENQAILLEKNYQKRYDGFDPNSETGYILLTMQQSAFLKQSLNFASKVQKQVKEKAGRIDKGVQQAGFLVLWRTSMPSVLIETEFISNTESEKFTTSEPGQDNMARAIFCAFRQYKDEIEGRYIKYDDEIEHPAHNTTLPVHSTAGEKEQKITHSTKDSVEIKKEPFTDSSTKPQITAGDSSLIKTEMAPPEKEKTVPKDSSEKTGSGGWKKEEKNDSDRITLKDTLNSVPLSAQHSNPVIRNDSIAKVVGQNPEQVIYKVQFLSSGQRIPMLSDKFKGLADVEEYQDSGLFKYTAGEFRTGEEAMKYRTEMQGKGHKDCFVVKFKNGKRMKN